MTDEFLLKFVEKVYRPGFKDYDILLSCGNTDALYKIFHLLLDPDDSVLVEEFTYPSALESMHPLQVNKIGVKMDREGMLDTDLEDILSNWEMTHRGSRPKAMYTVTYIPFPPLPAFILPTSLFLTNIVSVKIPQAVH